MIPARNRPVRDGVWTPPRSAVYVPGSPLDSTSQIEALDVKAWSRSGEGIQTSTGISQWDDRSGNSNHFTQGTGRASRWWGATTRGGIARPSTVRTIL